MPGASWILALLFASLLLAARPIRQLAFEEFVNWLLFVGLGAALIATFPSPRRQGTVVKWSSTGADQ